MLFLAYAKSQSIREKTEIRKVRGCIVYVPILKTLQRLLENEDIVTQVKMHIILSIIVQNHSLSTVIFSTRN